MLVDASRTRRVRAFFVATAMTTASCIPGPARIELPVPIAPIGGSRPATPAGLQIHAEFGDGLWGDAQQRIELGGYGIGGSFGDRYELGITTYFATRETGIPEPSGLRAKVRLADFADGAASIGLHVSRIRADVDNGVQNEHATAFDVALPVTYFPISDATGGANHVFGMYVAPRLVFESFNDRGSGESARGTLVSAVLGSTGRWRYMSATGELVAARTPSFGLTPIGVRKGFIVLPLLRASLIFPL